MLVKYIERGDTTGMMSAYIRSAGWGLLKTSHTLTVDSSKVASRYYVSTSPTTIAANYAAVSNGTNLIDRNLFDNNTYVGILNSKPIIFGSQSVAGLPTGVDGYWLDVSNYKWLARYNSTAGAWIYPMQSILAGGVGTAGSLLFLDANGRATQDNSNLNYTGNIFTTRRATASGIVAQFGSSTAADNMIIESLTGNTNAGKKTWRIGAPSQEGGAIESLSGNGGLAIYANRNLGNNGMMMRGGYQDNLWVVGYGGIHDGYNIWFRVNNNNRVAISIAADENIVFSGAASGSGVPNRTATNLLMRNDRLYNNKGVDVISTLSATADNQVVSAYSALPTFQNQSTSVRAVTIVSGGSGIANGSYTNIALDNGTGYGATANFTVSGGSITSITIVVGGAGYAVNDILRPNGTSLINSNTAQIKVTSIGLSLNPTYAIFHGRQPATGQNYYNVLAEGTAKNYFKGDFIVGPDSTLKYNVTTVILKLKTDRFQVQDATSAGSGILEVSDPFGTPGLVSYSGTSSANRGMLFLSTDAGPFFFLTAKRNNLGFRTMATCDTLGWGMGDFPWRKNATLTIGTHRFGDTTLAIRDISSGAYLGLFLNNGVLQLNTYGTPATTAPSQGKTESGYVASFADDGTVTSFKLARDTFIEDVTLFSVGTLLNSCQELTIVSSMTVLAPSNQEIRIPDAADYLRGKKIIVYSKKKDGGSFVPFISVVGGVSRLFYTTDPGIAGTDPIDHASLYIDNSTWSDHGTTFEFTCLKIDNTPSYRWVLKQR